MIKFFFAGFQPLGVVLPVTIVIVLVVAVITVFVIARHVKRRRNRQESCTYTSRIMFFRFHYYCFHRPTGESRSTRQRTSSDEMSTCMNTLNGMDKFNLQGALVIQQVVQL